MWGTCCLGEYLFCFFFPFFEKFWVPRTCFATKWQKSAGQSREAKNSQTLLIFSTSVVWVNECDFSFFENVHFGKFVPNGSKGQGQSRELKRFRIYLNN